MSATACIDLIHLGLEGAICCYLVDAREPAIVDPGPATTVEHLVAELGACGVGPSDLRHVLLTHVHLDHAGATGHLLERFPSAVVHVHEDGAPHLVNPERLVASTRRTFQDAHDKLWGEVRAVPPDRIKAWRSGAPAPLPGLRPIPTPGHIAHHLGYLDERDGTLFSGDSMGIVLSDGPTHPPTPPPAVDLRAWSRTLEEIGRIAPERFGATHFGLHEDVDARREQLGARLDALEARVRTALVGGDESDARRFDEEVREELAPYVGQQRVDRYFDMFSAANDWAGVAFYLQRNP
jgi:glyoxylase-like metal-dependent hydrolase (beta-lactamase superfamily II)